MDLPLDDMCLVSGQGRLAAIHLGMVVLKGVRFSFLQSFFHAKLINVCHCGVGGQIKEQHAFLDAARDLLFNDVCELVRANPGSVPGGTAGRLVLRFTARPNI